MFAYWLKNESRCAFIASNQGTRKTPQRKHLNLYQTPNEVGAKKEKMLSKVEAMLDKR